MTGRFGKSLGGPLGAVLISLASGGCNFDAHANEPRFNRIDDGLVFDGRITLDTVSTLMGLLGPGDTLIINSKGGDPMAALSLARHLNEARIELKVNGECEAECASYLFVLAPIRHATVGGSVRYSPSPFSRKHGALRSEALLQQYTQALAQAGVSKSLFDCIDAHLSGRPRSVKAAISRDILAKYGINVQGDYVWPADEGYREQYRDFSPGLIWIDDPNDCREKGADAMTFDVRNGTKAEAASHR